MQEAVECLPAFLVDRRHSGEIARREVAHGAARLGAFKALGGEELLHGLDIEPTARAEELSMEDFVAIANASP